MSDSNPDADLPMGTLLGTTKCGMNAYVTNYAQYRRDNPPPHDFQHYEDGIHTGLKWQCVEFARRYWIKHFAAVLRKIPIASEIWQQTFAWALPLESNKIVPIERFENGSHVIPMVGDLLIYGQHPNQRTGHVAVIVEVNENCVRVAEQNRYNDKLWVGGHYSHEIEMTVENGGFYLHDHDCPAMLGWMRLKRDEIVERPPWKPAEVDELKLGSDETSFCRDIQRFVGQFPDGILGKFTIRSLQRFLNLYASAEDQLDANNEDGIFDTKTAIVLQKFLNQNAPFSLLPGTVLQENGEFNFETCKAFHRFIKNIGNADDFEFAKKSLK